MFPALSLLIVALVLALARAKLSCIGDNGNEVDYFIILKVPKTGKYVYLDSDAPTFKKSKHDLSRRRRDDAVSSTLKQIYADAKTDVGFVMYNDRHPDQNVYQSRAHSKGVAALDDERGFWLTHSAPGFPNAVDDGYEPCCRRLHHAQHFMCMTLAPEQFDRLGRLGQINFPSQYDSYLPDSLRRKHIDFAYFVDDRKNEDTLSTSVQIESVGGQTFTVFAKSARWAKHFYEDLVAPSLGVNLQANTWQKGGGNAMESYCSGKSKYSVVNVEKQDRSGKKWKTSEDHSKWAISYFPQEKAVQTERGLGSRNRKWVCVGDINRKIMENNRGGGTTCIHSPNIWFEFRRGITAVEECATSTVFKTATA